jgi:hypothetical protein
VHNSEREVFSFESVHGFCLVLRGVCKSSRTESITNYTLTTINTSWEPIQRVITAKFTRLAHKIAIQLHLVAEKCTICSSRSRRAVRKLLVTPSYVHYCTHQNFDEVHSASYEMDTEGSFPRGKAVIGWSYRSPQSSAEVKNMWNYTSTTQYVVCD